MGRLLFSMSVSLDGFVDSPERALGWVRVDEELHRVFNEEAREVRAFLYGRRMYELMAEYWPTADRDPEATPAMLEFAEIWRATPKVVFSRTLRDVGHGAELVHDDAVAAVSRLKQADGDLDVGGPTLASSLIAAGLVDEYRLFLHPVVLGRGTRFFPPLEAAADLRLLESRTFSTGVVLLRYERA
jgi:dihydrofolate reductase